MTEDELNKWFLDQKQITQDGCWKWTGVINGGYGRFTVKGKRWLTHRYSLRLYLNREIPKELEVRHICNNSICYNPEHLCEGSHFQNMQDMVQSNRQATGERLSKSLKGVRHINALGSKNHKSKLTEDDVLEIIKFRETSENICKFSKKYDVSKTQIKRIYTGESWSHLTGFKKMKLT
jgi:hypothetical protein